MLPILLMLSFCALFAKEPVVLGIERLVQEQEIRASLTSKKIGLVTNCMAIDHEFVDSATKLKREAKEYRVVALFAPEHGFFGNAHAAKEVQHQRDIDGIPIYSLHGETRRPTDAMLHDVDLIIFDIQDVGTRTYTYISTLFYVMEESAKRKIPMIVTDRPNPMGGECVDGPLLEEKWRSFIGYINVPYCHGMTIGELAQYFNQEYQIGCNLSIVPMKGWKRSMAFEDTDLTWLPTSPQIPEASTPLYYPVTGVLGELQLLNIGVGYTLPFKVVAAPWIDAEKFAQALNSRGFTGVYFRPAYYRPFFGAYAHKDCQGVHIIITDRHQFHPIETQYLILGTLKNLYPERMKEALLGLSAQKKEMFCKANGTDLIYKMLVEEKYVIYPLKEMCQQARKQFLPMRAKYLLY